MATTIQTIELPKKARALDTSGNNNHGQIYSGRGLEFDGVSDYLALGSNVVISTGAWTVGAWINIHAITEGVAHSIMANVSSISTGYIGIRATGKLSIWDHSVAWREANTVLNLNTWYRVLWVYDGAGEITFYVNGVADGTGVLATANDDLHVGYIGAINNTPQRLFNGKIANFQTWDAAFTQADVTYDYLNPESLALNNSGTSLTNSNLKLWYPMQDGHRGQQSYILDGANTGYIDKLVDRYENAYGDIEGLEMHPSTASTIIHPTNSNIIFNPYIDTTISLDTNIKYAGEQSLKMVTGSGGSGVYSAKENANDRFSVIAGVAYKISGYIYRESGSGTINLHAKTGAGGNWDLGATVISPSSNETWEYWEAYYTASVSGDNAYLLIVDTSAAETYYLDNIEWGPINDKNHATTVFYGDELGPQGTFVDGDLTGWSLLSSATNTTDGTSDYADVTTSASSNAAIQTTSTFTTVVGRTYRVFFDRITGTQTLACYIDTSSETISSYSATAASYTLDFVATHTGHKIGFRGGSVSHRIFLDNVSVKEVGVASGWTDADQQLHIPQTALQSYNELAWFSGAGTVDGYITLDSEIATTDNDWSLSFWVFHQDNGASYSFIFGKNTDSKIIALSNSGNAYLSYRETGGTYYNLSDEVLPYGEWIHIVITATADTSMTAYVNGVAKTNSSMSDTELTFQWIMRGYQNMNYNILGSVNEISYYSDVLTADEALDLYNDGKAKSALEASGSAGLVGYWRNNGLSEWKDLKGSNDGNKTAGVTETILLPAGVDSSRDNQGFIMNRQRDTSSLNPSTHPPSVTEVPDFGDLDFGTGDFSVECWVQYGFINDSTFGLTGSSLNVILSTGLASSSNSEGINLLSTASDFKFRIGDGDKEDNLDIDPSPLTVGNWYHIVVTREGTALISYVNGAENNTMTITSGINVSRDEPLRIGVDRGTVGRYYKWPIDNVRFYSKVLSSPEVTRNYNAGKGSHRN